MSISSQPLNLIFTTLSTSLIICVVSSITLLSSGFIGPLGPIDAPVKQTFIIGAFIGAMHGLTNSILIFYYKPVSLLGNGVTTFMATVIVIFLLLIRFGIVYFINNNITISFTTIIQALHLGIMMLFTISLILLIPSLLVGSFNMIIVEFKHYINGI